jgi:hypothetical protein
VRARALDVNLKIQSELEMGMKIRSELALKKEPEVESEEEEEVRILLVEDHISIREALASSFEEEEGCEVAGQARWLRPEGC